MWANLITVLPVLTFFQLATNENWLNGFSFTPVIEPEHDNAFLTKNMFEVIASGGAHKVSYILGINSEEMLGYEGSSYFYS